MLPENFTEAPDPPVEVSEVEVQVDSWDVPYVTDSDQEPTLNLSEESETSDNEDGSTSEDELDSDNNSYVNAPHVELTKGLDKLKFKTWLCKAKCKH